MIKQLDFSDSYLNSDPTVCPHCNAHVEINDSKMVHYCGNCGGALTYSAAAKDLLRVYPTIRDNPDIFLVIDEKVRETYNQTSKKHNWKTLPDPRDVFPHLARQNNPESSYLAQIAKELHEISMKLGPSASPEPAPEKRGRTKKNPN